MNDYFSRYVKACRMDDGMEKLAALMECAEQEENEMVCMEARYKVGLMFWTGEGTEQDKEAAKELMQSSADMGFVQAMEFYAKMLREEGDEETAKEYEDQAAKKRLPDEELDRLRDDIIRGLKRQNSEEEAVEKDVSKPKEVTSSGQKVNPFGGIDVIICAVVALVPTLIIKFIFKTGFLVPWIIFTVLLCLWVLMGDKKK